MDVVFGELSTEMTLNRGDQFTEFHGTNQSRLYRLWAVEHGLELNLTNEKR